MTRGRLGVLAALALLGPGRAQGQEPEVPGCPAGVQQVQARAGAAVEAFSTMDDLGFQAAVGGLPAVVVCLVEPITPPVAAAVHRALALAAFLEQDDAAALRAFQASQASQPGYTLPVGVAPPGGELAMTYERASALQSPPYTLIVPEPGLSLLLDGAPSARKREGLPVILQLVDRHDRIAWSGYLLPGDPLPAGAHAAPTTCAEPSPRVVVPTSPAGVPVMRLAGAGAMAGSAVALGVGALARRGAWRAAEEHCEAKVGGCSQATADATQHVRAQALGLGIGAGAAAASGLALGASLVLRW